MNLSGKRVTVAGLGRFGGGIAVAKWLCGQGANVLVTDRDPLEKLADSVRQLDGLPIEYRLGGHEEMDFTKADLVVASPALPPEHPMLLAARGANVPVSTEIRIFLEQCRARRIIGITGTKAKSTTTAMLGKILATGFKTWVGGNIGKSLLNEVEKIGAEDVVVLELSSFMLEHLRAMMWSPQIAVVTMIAADHLDWHKTLEAYVDAKRNILRFQMAEDWAVLNEEDAVTAGLAHQSPGHVLLYGTRNRKRFELILPGEHNQLNAQGAFAAASILGMDWSVAQAALADFVGLPHRLQLVGEVDGVRYYDDSIATVPEAAIVALDAFAHRKVIQIVGGKDKGLPITALCAALSERAKAVLCIGTTGPVVADVLERSVNQGAAACYRCGDLATAVAMAKKISHSGDVVLLSPGFASLDQFVNFEERGRVFADAVRGK